MYAQSWGKVSNDAALENIVEATRENRFEVSSLAKIKVR